MTTPYGDGRYRVELFERAPGSPTRSKRAEIGNITSLKVDRTINGISQAALDLPVPPTEVEQNRLSALRTIRFELDVWRDEDLLWGGPITTLDFGRANVLVGGKDFLWWLSRRFIRQRVAYEDEVGADGTHDVALIAGEVATTALLPDDPNLLAYLTVSTGGGFAQARYEVSDRHTALEAWDDLTSQGLDYTALGRLLVAAGGQIRVPDLPPISDADFLGEVRVVESGEEACTSAAVIGGGLVGKAGGTDAYYGLVERRFEAPSTVTSQDVLDKMAVDQVAARNPPPLLVQIPSGGALGPTCAVRPYQLIPGAVGLITVSYVLRPVAQRMRLSQVAFEKRGADDEQVTDKFQPVGALADDQ